MHTETPKPLLASIQILLRTLFIMAGAAVFTFSLFLVGWPFYLFIAAYHWFSVSEGFVYPATILTVVQLIFFFFTAFRVWDDFF